MTTTDIAGLCEKVRFSEICISALGAEVDRLTDTIERLAAENKRLRGALERSQSLLRECLGDYSHRNFTDRHGMADRIRAALTGEAS